jgi:amino acid transporter
MTMQSGIAGDSAAPGAPASLPRVIGLWPFVFYGLGVIVGAGIYVAIGDVVSRAGDAAPVSFLLAGVTALFTGLCYAELAGRFPDAAGGASYVGRGFGSRRLAQVVGLLTTVSVAIAAASIAGGAVRYVTPLVAIPAPLIVTVLVVGFTVIAASGVRASVGLAAIIGVLEIGGLIVAIATGFLAAPDLDLAGLWPANSGAWQGALAGAFIAFFAFIGFETMANLGEEVRRPKRILPLGIILAVAASIILYVAVAAAAVLSGRSGDVPLLSLFEGRAVSGFALVGAIAISNGVLVEIVMLARLFYGLASRGELPAALAKVDARTRTPVIATVAAGAIILATALVLPFQQLLMLANASTLVIFVLVDLALWRVHRTSPATAGGFAAPRWVPPVGAALAAILLAAEFVL